MLQQNCSIVLNLDLRSVDLLIEKFIFKTKVSVHRYKTKKQTRLYFLKPVITDRKIYNSFVRNSKPYDLNVWSEITRYSTDIREALKLSEFTGVKCFITINYEKYTHTSILDNKLLIKGNLAEVIAKTVLLKYLENTDTIISSKDLECLKVAN